MPGEFSSGIIYLHIYPKRNVMGLKRNENETKMKKRMKYMGKSCVSEYFWLYLYI